MVAGTAEQAGVVMEEIVAGAWCRKAVHGGVRTGHTNWAAGLAYKQNTSTDKLPVGALCPALA